MSSQRYAGRAQSAECLQAALREMEHVLGLHPRRRTEQVQARLNALAAPIGPIQAGLTQKQAERGDLFAKLQMARHDEAQTQAEVARWAAEFEAQGRLERPASQLAKARQRLDSAQQRQRRAGRDLQTNAARLTKLEHHLADRLTQPAQLWEWRAELESDKATRLNPLTLVLRVDAGFSTDDNLTWLIERGYVVYTQAPNRTTTAQVRRQVAGPALWQRVGGNAEAVYLPHPPIAQCPSVWEALRVRYPLPTGDRYTTLLYSGDSPPPEKLTAGFQQYNARPTLEAGIKEGKSVFPRRRPWVRSPFGLQVQEQFSRFAANFVRWAARWAKHVVRQANRLMHAALTEVKTLVRVMTRCRARVVVNTLGRVISFDEPGPFAGSMFLVSGQVTYQHVLPLFNRSSFRPHATT